ncbi:hypothetical protein [uncultured Nonlabens sp.]|uniref:hypothetical protein n=1 Tax=uncultured Nonlabens sp. TaxID=859306 RepID=UPI00261F463C|nr:hypothetical protein [uncultured Nonlabens sp.]
MGAYLSFNFIKKTENMIIGELPSLQVFEAKLPVVEKNYLNNGDDGCSFKWGGYIFTEFEQNSNRWEYYTYEADCYFIKLANILAEVDQRSYDERTVYLYEISKIKKSIENVLKYSNSDSFSDNQAREEDRTILSFFLNKLTQYENKEAYVICSVG